MARAGKTERFTLDEIVGLVDSTIEEFAFEWDPPLADDVIGLLKERVADRLRAILPKKGTK